MKCSLGRLVFSWFAFAFVCCFLSAHALAQSSSQPLEHLTATDIMARVAANQDATEAERLHYVYVQHARISSLKGHTIQCEEITDSRVTPTPNGGTQQILKLDGRLLRKGKYIDYDKLTVPKASQSGGDGDESDEDTDLKLVQDLRHDLTNTKSKDGLASGLFPLTSRTQADYDFRLLGSARMNEHDAFHIAFEPKDKTKFEWKGDAYIDSTAFQPVLVRTTMSRDIPLGVRMFLGISLPGLGFTVTYEPQADGLWFPVTFGTHFNVHILFFFKRKVIVDARNTDFEKTHVTSTIHIPEPTPDYDPKKEN